MVQLQPGQRLHVICLDISKSQERRKPREMRRQQSNMMEVCHRPGVVGAASLFKPQITLSQHLSLWFLLRLILTLPGYELRRGDMTGLEDGLVHQMAECCSPTLSPASRVLPINRALYWNESNQYGIDFRGGPALSCSMTLKLYPQCLKRWTARQLKESEAKMFGDSNFQHVGWFFCITSVWQTRAEMHRSSGHKPLQTLYQLRSHAELKSAAAHLLKVKFPNTLINNHIHPLSSRSPLQWGLLHPISRVIK